MKSNGFPGVPRRVFFCALFGGNGGGKLPWRFVMKGTSGTSKYLWPALVLLAVLVLSLCQRQVQIVTHSGGILWLTMKMRRVMKRNRSPQGASLLWPWPSTAPNPR